ncbi:hypothetical protein HUT18_17400 [Streptomyces sp. NA04227]|uniref:hypothetical protein n=1 Tax=Streptomyces sp. NA04227 TaxID=2742136 RepID=UPI00159007A6|nr:hypothetical protein [Streptomyces sp. NA04227]QKW07900.1 hypothetical protein HUT18_17400 [Streptomyces sp. NA04227]
MNARRRDEGCATAPAAAQFLLRCAALLALVIWAVPVCSHAASGSVGSFVPDPSAPVSASVAAPVNTSASAPVNASAELTEEHLCPGSGHSPGDTDCRAATRAPVLPASAAPGCSPGGPDAHPPALRSGTALPGPGMPEVREHTPGIHQLQVQRT